MERKLSVALILGAHHSIRLLEVFGPLSEDFDIKALGLLEEISPESYMTDIPLQTFIEDNHLPGFMLGVEEEIAKADVVIASSLLDAATYQAFRYAYHHQKPFLLFCQKEEELKQAILGKSEDFQDCINNASGFLIYDETVGETLEFMGCDPSRILVLQPEIQAKKFGFHEKLRKKFRDYLKVEENELLVVSQLSEDLAPLELMSAFKMLQALDAELFQRSKLLFIGSAPSKDSVKYRAVDLGMTKSIMFIAQDIRPFFVDLMSATDLYVALSRGHDATESLFTVLEGMACGVKVLLDERHALAGVVDSNFVVSHPRSVALALRDVLLKSIDRKEIIKLVAARYTQNGASTLVSEFLKTRIAEKPLQLPLAGDFSQVLTSLLSKAREGLDVFLEALELEMNHWGSHSDYKGRLLVLKGQTLLQASQFDEALAVFELCTAEEHVQREAYLGLARIALFTHSNEEALSFYRKALALKPNDAEAMGGIGNVYRKIGMADEAVYWLGKSISVDVENSRYLIALTQACNESEDHDRAIALLEQLKILLGNKPSLVMCLGQLYFKVGNNEKGKELVDLALEITSGIGQLKLLPSSDVA
ncbi:MAG: glycosyltransferase [Chitinophagaceae bacterium]|nr:glycosyltransferase [Oligoflexus sp.]